jgi:hypothetical protein
MRYENSASLVIGDIEIPVTAELHVWSEPVDNREGEASTWRGILTSDNHPFAVELNHIYQLRIPGRATSRVRVDSKIFDDMANPPTEANGVAVTGYGPPPFA